MTFSHDDIRERLVDYLYGELDGTARAAFQAHLAACTACRAEVAGAERARMVAREVVRRPLGDAVPEQVRARALEAARAAVALRGGTAPAQAKGAAVASPAPVQVDDGDGWFRRLRRRWTWTFPTFATVAAMAVFLLVRATVFREAKHPVSEETVRELAKTAPERTSEPPMAPGAVPAAEPGLAGAKPSASKRKTAPAKSEAIRDIDEGSEAPAPGSAQAAKGGTVAPSVADRLTGTGAGALSRRSAASGGHPQRQPAVGGISSVGAPSGGGAAVAQPAPHAASPRKGRAKELALPDDGAFDDLAGGAEAEQGRARGQDALVDKTLEKQSNPERGATARAGAFAGEAPKASSKKVAPEPAATARKRDFAPPPPPAPAPPAPASAIAPAPAMKSSAPPQLDVEESPAAENRPAVTSAAPASEAKHGKKSKTTKDEEPLADAAPPREREKQAARADESAAPAVDPALALASRADGLMHARRWNDAVTAYRDLLRRYPAHPAAAVWRQRLAAAQAALAADSGQFAAPPPPRR